MKKYEPDWDFSFAMDASVRCAFCLKSDMPMLVRGGETAGVCEPCAVIVHYLWRQVPGEVPPEYPKQAQDEVARVYVLIPKVALTNRVVKDNGEEVHTKPDPLLSNSYEFVMMTNEEGTLDLPGVNVIAGETLRKAAERALALVKVTTWSHPDFIEPLYTAYTPRGRLAAVMLVTAWSLDDPDATQDGLGWRRWPLSEHASPMKGFYRALETVWTMRLRQYHQASSKTETISVRVRGVAANYIKLQRGIRAKDANLDTSMMEIMRRMMTDDEKKIDKLVGEYEVLSRELSQQKLEEAQAAGEEPSDDAAAMARMSRGEQVLIQGSKFSKQAGSGEGGAEEEEASAVEGAEEDSAVADDSGSPLEATTGEDESEEGLEEDEVVIIPPGPPPEGFVRRGKDLSMKKESE